jgi:signal transduction histidine kinase
VQVQLAVVGAPVELPAALDLTSYRIVQEALTNTVKHSGASRATVELRYTPAALLIDVVDDGTATPVGDDGHGLIGIGERVALFGGSMLAGPDRGGGWRVHAELPLPTSPVPGHRAAAVPAP